MVVVVVIVVSLLYLPQRLVIRSLVFCWVFSTVKLGGTNLGEVRASKGPAPFLLGRNKCTTSKNLDRCQDDTKPLRMDMEAKEKWNDLTSKRDGRVELIRRRACPKAWLCSDYNRETAAGQKGTGRCALSRKRRSRLTECFRALNCCRPLSLRVAPRTIKRRCAAFVSERDELCPKPDSLACSVCVQIQLRPLHSANIGKLRTKEPARRRNDCRNFVMKRHK